MARRFGYDQGFGTYDDEFIADEASITLDEWEGMAVDSAGFDRRADATTERALAWLDGSRRDRPVFLWVHYYDPHEPYDPPPAYRDVLGLAPAGSELERAIAAYDAEIRFADDQLGRLIDDVDRRLGARDTLVVVATDHGEGLMQHGWMGHGANLYEELVRTVLVFRRPGHVRVQRIDPPVGLIDVTPTILAHLDLDAGERAPGSVNLDPTLRAGVPPPADRPLYFQRRVYQPGSRADVPIRGEMSGVRIGPWKYLEASAAPPELYDLATDPGETRNLVARDPERAAELAAVLARRPRVAAADRPLSAEDARRLRALGYVE
jgi:arylsulfatase A-like enzyme